MSAKALLSASVSAPPPVYVEDVFSTYLYTGNGSTQTITNGIDLDGEGGLVWIKQRSTESPVGNHYLYDTTRGAQNTLSSNTTDASYTRSGSVTSFNSSGFSVGNDGIINGSGRNLASWTFRKAEKFFDVVTYTGTGSARTIAHNLGSVPGCIIVKCTNSTDSWFVYHVGTGAFNALVLNSTDAAFGNNNYWNNTSPTSSVFSVGSDLRCNGSGQTYVAYLFAHDAGGFGDSGDESVVSCGSYTGTGSNVFVNLGWEPQWVLTRAITWDDQWGITDTMRGMPVTGSSPVLFPNLSNAESIWANLGVTATGFNSGGNQTGSGQTYIYIAIRRGPMRAPESGTEVFAPVTSQSATGTKLTTGFPVDMQVQKIRSQGGDNYLVSRLTGVGTLAASGEKYLITNSTAAEASASLLTRNWDNTGYETPGGWNNFSTAYWNFRRAPGFFDVVAYTGTGVSNRAISHNLTVAPQMIIAKCRSASGNSWPVYHSSLTSPSLSLNEVSANQPGNAPFFWGNDSTVIAPTSSVFTVGGAAAGTAINGSGSTYIAYLFATLTGVSKVGSYTGTGTTLNIDCGFTAGARFVLIKRTDSTGDWYVWDTARGIISGNDPYLLLNSTAAEVTNTDYIDPLSSGFQISSTAPAAINASGGTYIFLSIA
jgi:hypothetical protein